MRVQRLGHACLLVETDDARLLFDPGRFSNDWHTLTDLDAVLITHQHTDHVDPPAVAALMGNNSGARIVVEKSVVDLLSKEGLQAEEAVPHQQFDVGSLRVAVEGGRHAVIHPSIPLVGNVGFVVSENGGARLYHPGDSYDYALEGIDLLALPLTAPWARAAMTADFLAAVRPQRAFPIHDAIVSQGGWDLYMRLSREITGIDVESVEPTGSLEV